MGHIPKIVCINGNGIGQYCAGGRIPGAVKMAGVWLIPKDAEKPHDRRTKDGKQF